MFRESINKAVSVFGGLTEWPDFGMQLPVCLSKNGKKPMATNGMLARCSLAVWTLVLLLHCSLATEGKTSVTAGAAPPTRPREPAARLDRGRAPPQGERGPRGQPAFMLVEPLMGQLPAVGKPLGLLSKAAWTRSSSSTSSKTSKAKAPSQPSSPSSARATSRDNQTVATETPSPVSTSGNLSSSNSSSDSEEPMSSLPAWDLPTVPESLLSTLGDHDITLPDNITSPFSTHQWNTTAPGHTGNSSKQIPTLPTTTTTTTRMHLTPPLVVTSTNAPPPSSTAANTMRVPLASTAAPGSEHTVTNGSRRVSTVTAAAPPLTTSLAVNGSQRTTAETAPTAPTTVPTAATTAAAATTPRAAGVTPTSEAAAQPAATSATPDTITTTTATMATSPPTTAAAAATTTTTTTTTTLPTTTAPPTTTTPTTTPTTTTTTTTTTTPAPTTTSTTASTTTTTAAATTTTSTTSSTTTAKIHSTTSAAYLVPEQSTPARITTTEPTPSSTAEEGALPCNITEKYWVKTVLSIQLRRNHLDLILKQNLAKGLSHALQRALNDTSASAQVSLRVHAVPNNMTLAYYVTSGKTIYIASLVVEALNVYGFDKLLSDIRQHIPLVKAVLVPVATWLPAPSVHLQLKTVLRFIGPTDNIYSCSFVQMLEQRLENAFDEAQDKVLETYSRLTVEIQSVSQIQGSPSVAVVYVVRNQDALLNGTISSGLLNQLTAELVGYFLFYPPLLIAEPLEYHNLNTSTATKNYWVITVIQDVDSGSLESSYQSFASLMEQRLAELFLVAGRHGTQVARARRATTVGGYTVQMVSMRRLTGPKNPAEMTYYAQLNGEPILGTTAAKTLSTLDSQTMALTLGYFVQIQAEPVVKTPPGNLWILAVLTPVVLLVVVLGMVAFILCKRNRVIFKTSAFRTFKSRSKPVQGFDYAKKHIGRPGDETTSVTKETLLLALPARDAPLSLERKAYQDGTANKRPSSTDMHKGGRLPSEEGGSMSSGGSGKLNTGKSSSTRRTATAGSIVGSSIKTNGKDELHKRGNNGEGETERSVYPYEDHSGSLRLITIKPMTAQPTYSYPSSSSHSQDSVVLNGEANHSGLKQKSDIEHYRNKLRQKARRKGYGEFSLSGSGSHAHAQRDARHGRHDNGLKEPMTAEEKRASFAGCHKGYSHPREPAYWSRQSLSSPSPVETEMDLLVLRERSRRGIRNNGYDGEAEPFEETNVDRLMTSLGFGGGGGGTGSTRNGSLGVKGHRGSDSSTLSSQPSIDEVRSQMHMLLGNAFSLAPPDHDPPSHHRYIPHAHSVYNPAHTAPYCGGVTSAPGTMNQPCGGRQRSTPGYGDMHQCSLPKPGFRFTQLPDMGIGSPPPLIPSRPGPPPGTSVRRSTPDVSLKPRVTEASEQHNGGPYLPLSRTPFPAVTVDQSITSYSGNPMTAVYAISANHPGYSDYYVMSPPSSYRSPSWMSYPPEHEDLPRQWSDNPNSRHLETIC
ncbi:unnamed protein product [Lota lota]